MESPLALLLKYNVLIQFFRNCFLYQKALLYYFVNINLPGQ